MTLSGSKGKLVKIREVESVRNLPQIKLGDSVNAGYYETPTISV